jgi:hypothetical protein
MVLIQVKLFINSNVLFFYEENIVKFVQHLQQKIISSALFSHSLIRMVFIIVNLIEIKNILKNRLRCKIHIEHSSKFVNLLNSYVHQIKVMQDHLLLLYTLTS